jgi:hypothetical protein
MNYFFKSLVVFTFVVILLVGEERALAAEPVNTGTQVHLVLVSNQPIGPTTKVALGGQYLVTPKTDGKIYFATIGLRQALPHNVWIQPYTGFVGGWFKGQDGLVLATMGGVSQGPIVLSWDFEKYFNGSHRTKFWYHALDYKAGPWNLGVHFNKVNRSERFGPQLGWRGGDHWKLEGRYYRTIAKVDKAKPFHYGRVSLVIS